MSGRFAALVKGGLRAEGITLREACRRAEMDPSFLSKVLQGKRTPPGDFKALGRLAAAVGLDPAELSVSAGRIPEAWRRLLNDRPLFESVHRLVTGRRPAPSAPGGTASQAPRAELGRKPETFSEELL